MDGVDPYTQDPIEPGETFTYEFTALEPAVGMYHSHHDAQIQVPNGMAGAFLIGDMPIPASLVADGYAKVDPARQHGPQRCRHDRAVAERQELPGHRAVQDEGRRVDARQLLQRGADDPPDAPPPAEGLHHRQGRHPARPADARRHVRVAPGERYTVLYKADDPGVWAWHCHILNHAEGPEGMFGMVTAIIVEPA